jgi:transcriptional regulator with XRE-family HTH domain
MPTTKIKAGKEAPLRPLGKSHKDLKSINDRIEFVRVSFNYPVNAYAKKLGVSRTGVTNVISSKINNDPSYEMLQTIVKVFPVSNEWLMIGKGQPFTKDDITDYKYVDLGQEPSMDIEVNQRLRQFRLDTGESQTIFADRVKVTRDVIAFIENNRQSITIPILKRAVKNCNINPMWLLFGIGNKERTK